MLRSLRRKFAFYVASALAVIYVNTGILPVASADSLRSDTALGWIPSDASFFTTMLRNREQLDRLLNSNAYKRLTSMPLVQMGVMQAKSQMFENEDFKEWLDDSDNEELVEALKDAVSHEVFIYGGDGFQSLFKAFVALGEVSNQVQFESISNGGNIDDDVMVQKMLERVAADLNELEVPRLVIGFRLGDRQAAKKQLGRLEELCDQGATEDKDFADVYKKQAIDGENCLTVTLSSSMIPWDDISDGIDEDEEERAKSLERIKSSLEGKQVVVSLGLRDDYLVLQTGESVDAMQGFGRSGSKLIDHQKMSIVRKHASKPVTSIGYASEKFLRAVYQPGQQLDNYVGMAKGALAESPLEDDLKVSLAKDLEELSTDVKQYYPEMGAVASVQYMTDDGYEGYSQNWAENLMVDASKPLDILKNVGGDPLAVIALRSKHADGRGYRLMSKWFSRFGAYGRKLAEENMDDEQRPVYDKVMDRALPLLKDFDDITKNDYLSALKDGQVAFVIDGDLNSRQWHLMMPPASEPLPMVEFAQVLAVTDPGRLKAAYGKYAGVADQLLEYVKEVAQENDEAIQDGLDGPLAMLPALLQSAKIPRPTPRETSDGTIYEFSGLAQLGLDGRLAPAAGISKDRFVFSLSPKTTERLLAPTKLKASGPLSDTSRKLGTAVKVDMAGLVGVVRAWTNYGMATAAELQDEEQITAMIPTVDGVLEFLQCYRSIESASYVEADSMMTHTRARFEDLAD